MKRVIITAAEVNKGIEVIRFLYKTATTNQIITGVKNIDNVKIGSS